MPVLPAHGQVVAGLPRFPAEAVLIEGRGPAIRPGISQTEAALLRSLAQDRSVLEVGSAFGYSAVVMGYVARSLVSVDPHTLLDSLETFRANVAGHGLTDKITPVVGTSQEVLPELLKKGARFELIFIDGDHEQDVVRHDALWARHLVTDDGLIAFHDYQPE